MKRFMQASELTYFFSVLDIKYLEKLFQYLKINLD